MTISLSDFRAAMGAFPGAVTIIATGEGQQRRGITATAVCSVTDSPPSLLACINRASSTRSAIAENRQFSVSLLDPEAEKMARDFAGQTGVTGADKFADGAWDRFDCGVPRLTLAPLSMACAVSEMHEVGSHSIFIGQIKDIHFGHGAAMVYQARAFHRLVPLAAG